MKCPDCNKEVNDGIKFCPYCATPIASNKCPHCGSTNLPADSKFCPDCGGKLENNTSSNGNMLTFNVNGVSFNMIRVEHGEFMMGTIDEEDEKSSPNLEQPVHKVILTRDFFLGETLVSQSLWRAVMNENPSCFGEGGAGSYVDKWNDLPVESISWVDCQKFICKLNKLIGEDFRLPTEAEWEYAARGGNLSVCHKYSGSNILKNVAWYEKNSNYEPHPVKGLAANELGIYDLTGNVSEYCHDWFDFYINDMQIDPIGPTRGIYRVLRGGCYSDNSYYCRLSYRRPISPSSKSNYTGLRLALSKS